MYQIDDRSHKNVEVGVKNEVLLNLVKYIEMNLHESREKKQFFFHMSFVCQEYKQSHDFYITSIARLVEEQLASF